MPIFPKLLEMLPDADHLLNLEPEELAGPLLVSLEGSERINPEDIISHDPMSRAITGDLVEKYPRSCHDDILFALMEAWQWLKSEVLVAPRPAILATSKTAFNGPAPYFVTRRGKRIKTPNDLIAYREGLKNK